jgi:hypothetical protein
MKLRTVGAAILTLAGTGAAAETLPRFPPNAVWHRDISAAPLHPNSAAMITALDGLGGWGNGNKFQIDFSFVVLHADMAAPTVPVVAWPTTDDYYSPDCDPPGTLFPLPPGGVIEGSSDYTCDHDNEDCHLLVVQGNRLWEAYLANVPAAGNSLEAICALHWDLDKVYPPEGRGEQCTSGDAAGYPIAPLLFNADEVYAATQVAGGDLGHAIRFILPNPFMAAATYVHPATHAGGPSGPATTVPYGVRMRLKSSFDMSQYNAAAQVILRTMQRYGIVLADGGNIALTADADTFTTHTWSELGITSPVFNPGTGNPAVAVTDFEIVDTGPRIALTYDCVRVPDDFLFIDHFQH